MKMIQVFKYLKKIALVAFFFVTFNPYSVAAEYGTYLKPFQANSLWNSTPVNPKFSDFEIPKSLYYPAVQQGKYSTGMFLASETDSAENVYSYDDKKGIWDPDSEVYKPFITVARWPHGVIPALGSDGHADIVDEVQGVIHSFWQLKSIAGKWYATQYAWTKLNGKGWSEPGHYFQGARAAAVPSSAGIIRQHEIEDGKEFYGHALALSLTNNGLAGQPSYTFPATSGDTDAVNTNSGKIPEGALLMLPPDFDMTKIKSRKLIKIAKTLKVYGAYVVDANYGTPYVIYVENGPKEFSLLKPNVTWDNQVANELDLIRAGLRQVSSADGWLSGAGELFTPSKNLNLLSMRGPWRLSSNGSLGEFDTLKQAVVFDKTTSRVVQDNFSGRSMNSVDWAKPKVGNRYKLTAVASGGATLILKIFDKSTNKVAYQSNELGNGDSVIFSWPAESFSTMLTVMSGVGNGSTISAELLRVD